MATNQWHYSNDGQVKGPYNDEQLKSLCEVGTVTAKTYVWKPDYPDWKRLAESDFQYKSAIMSQPMPSQPPVSARQAPSASASYQAATNELYDDDYNYEVEDLSLWEYFTRAITSKYVDFQGRARRKEYWGFVLFNFIGLCLAFAAGIAVDTVIKTITSYSWDAPIVTSLLTLIYLVGTLLPGLAILARRLHDINLSAWFILLHLLPYLGGIIVFIMTVLSSYPGRNKYGPSPVEPFAPQRDYA
ncbi:MAG: DUF805 domain-containing protein [Alphaproteobacteria bacterium]